MKAYTVIYRRNRAKNDLGSHRYTCFKTQKDVQRDVRCNGYAPLAVLTDEQIEKIHAGDIDMILKYPAIVLEYVHQCL